MFYIYVYTNLVNLKKYVGQTYDLDSRKSKHISDAKNGSNFHFHKAIRKYGLDQFQYDVIEEFQTIEEVNEAEEFWISFFGSFNRSLGYNMTKGGDSHIVRDESKKRMSTANQNRSEEKKAEIAAKKSATQQNKTPDEKAKFAAKISAITITAHQNRSEEKKAERLAKISNTKQNKTPEEKAKTALKKSIANRKFSDEQELEIYNLYLSGVTQAELAKRYGCAQPSIYNIYERVKKRLSI